MYGHPLVTPYHHCLLPVSGCSSTTLSTTHLRVTRCQYTAARVSVSSPILSHSMHSRHLTAPNRARARKRSTPLTHTSSDESLKHQRTHSNSSVNDENINTINTQSASLTMSPPPSSFSSSSSSSTVEWRSCGHCPAPSVSDTVNTLQHCCWHIEPAGRLLVDSAPLCEGNDIASVIRDGVSDADFDYCCKRIKGSTPALFAGCSAAQKRLVLYGALHRMLYGQGSRGQRDPLPECIKHMVRSTYVDDSGLSLAHPVSCHCHY